MVEVSLSGSGEDLGRAIARGYSTIQSPHQICQRAAIGNLWSFQAPLQLVKWHYSVIDFFLDIAHDRLTYIDAASHKRYRWIDLYGCIPNFTKWHAPSVAALEQVVEPEVGKDFQSLYHWACMPNPGVCQQELANSQNLKYPREPSSLLERPELRILQPIVSDRLAQDTDQRITLLGSHEPVCHHSISSRSTEGKETGLKVIMQPFIQGLTAKARCVSPDTSVGFQ